MITPYNLYEQPFKVVFAFAVLALWSLIWQGLALWSAAQEKKKGWFIALLILNTLGILPIIYLIWFREKKEEINVEPDNQEEKHKTKKTTSKKKVKKIEEEKKE